MSDLNKQSASLTPETLPDRETILRRWDTWRKRIAQGNCGSWPRDEFEMLLDGYEEEIDEAMAVVTGLLDFPTSPSWNIRARAFLSKHQRAE